MEPPKGKRSIQEVLQEDQQENGKGDDLDEFDMLEVHDGLQDFYNPDDAVALLSGEFDDVAPNEEGGEISEDEYSAEL
jgi:hypothetical protein